MVKPKIFKARPGMSLIDVALATVIATVSTLVAGQFFRNAYDQLSPRGDTGGLRRYLLSEEMLRAQAEGLRTLRTIPLTDQQCKLVTEPAGLKYSLTIARTRGPDRPNEELYYFDLSMSKAGVDLNQTISMSTLRSIGSKEGQDEKIGL